MAEDQWHHVEGTLPAANLFTLYFYDNFTKPIAPTEFTAHADRELPGTTEKLALTPSANKRTLQVKLNPGPMPVKLKVWVSFKKGTREQPFDFSFDKISVDTNPTAPAAPTTTRNPTTPAAKPDAPRTAAPAASSASSSAKPPAAAAAKPAPATPSTAAASAPSSTQAPTQTPAPAPSTEAKAPLILDNPLQIPPALADALDESKLPADMPGLLKELDARSKEIDGMVNNGNLAEVWLAATGAKTVALVIDTRAAQLPERQRVLVTAAVKRIVTAAWDLDAYGDLGNREKIVEAYDRMASAVKDLKDANAR
jgi:hypothetical protein